MSRRSEKFLPNLDAARVEFSPDRQWMAIIQSHGTERVLWRARADGTEWRQLTVPPIVVLLASYSPDGKRIAFMGKTPNRPWKVYWVAAEGGALHELRVPIENQGDPNWSLDNESLMFGQPPLYFGEPNIPRAIYIYNLRTHRISKLPGSEGWFSPRWSSDRSHVAAISIDGLKLGIFDFARQQWRELAQGSIDSPFWSSDGAWVYFNSPADGRLRRISVGGGTAQEVLTFSDVAPGTTDCFAEGFTPDNRLLIACNRTDANIYALQWSE